MSTGIFKRKLRKGGIAKNSQGYILIYSPTHPFRDNHLYVREHRLVMEKHLGRYLKPKEIIHHINGIVSDNIIENLMLLQSAKEHMKYHPSNLKGKKLSKEHRKKLSLAHKRTKLPSRSGKNHWSWKRKRRKIENT